MSDDNDETEEGTGDGPDQPYEIGYGRPPKSTQFAKGVSGNPRGRPKGSKNREPDLKAMRDMVLRQARTKITAKEQGQTISIGYTEAALRSVAVRAVQGDFKSQKLFLEQVERAEKAEQEEIERRDTVLWEYKRLGEKAIEHARRNKKDPPEFLIHPEDIYFDEQTQRMCTRKSRFEELFKLLGTVDQWQYEIDSANEFIRANGQTKDARIRAQVWEEIKRKKGAEMQIKIIKAFKRRDLIEANNLLTEYCAAPDNPNETDQ